MQDDPVSPIFFDGANATPVMIASSPAAPAEWKSVRAERPRSALPAMPDADSRQRLIRQAADLNEKARIAAEQGDLEAAARGILAALDCERRAGGLGPQVLQLIKPRG
jgi:hypothetical protein